MQVRVIVRADGGGDTALGVPGIVFTQQTLGDGDDRERIGQAHCKRSRAMPVPTTTISASVRLSQ
jgi:hypothetical protein